MAAKPQEQQHTNHENHEREQRNALIGRQVIHTLGQPQDFHKVQVRPLWEDHYRVNVLVGVDASATKVAHSYFLDADGAGNILGSTPKLVRQYGPVAGGTAAPALCLGLASSGS